MGDRITESVELEGVHKDHRVQLLPLHRTISKSHTMRSDKSFLTLSFGHMGNNKAPNFVSSVIQKCPVFHWAAVEARKQHIAHTGKNWPGKVSGGEELDSFNSICVFLIAWILFVHVTQRTSSTHNKSLSIKLGKIKTEKLKIHRFIYGSPLISACFTFRVHGVSQIDTNTHWQLPQFRDIFTIATWAARSKMLVYNTEIPLSWKALWKAPMAAPKGSLWGYRRQVPELLQLCMCFNFNLNFRCEGKTISTSFHCKDSQQNVNWRLGRKTEEAQRVGVVSHMWSPAYG